MRSAVRARTRLPVLLLAAVPSLRDGFLLSPARIGRGGEDDDGAAASQLTLPDGSRARATRRATTPLEVAGVDRRRGWPAAAVAGMLDGAHRRPARAARRLGRAFRVLTARTPRPARSSATRPSTCWPTRSSACSPAPSSTPAARTTPRSSSTTSASRAASRPRTSSGSRRRCARIVEEDASLRAHRGDREQAAEVFDARARRGDQARPPRRHPGGRDDHALPPRRASSTCAAGRTCSAPSRSAPSSCSRPPAPTSRATSATRCCSASTAPPSRPRTSSTPTSRASRRLRRRDHRRLGRSSTSSRSPRWRRRRRSSTRAAPSSTTS